ncbi:formate dehydrogenase accessory sulfurtransferase FdhD [Christensenellaceae bacterium OttesenSCG-928-L17]|nr:formate dehydrogenase accessory sulfurtransferase FdhD [Christensenellaceae bacterium OttesenSCG-928-L17]
MKTHADQDVLGKVNIIRIKGETAHSEEDIVVREHTLSLYLDGRLYTQMLCTPQHLQELAVGHLYSEGVIRSMREIAAINQPHACAVEITRHAPDSKAVHTSDAAAAPARTVTTGCGAQKSGAYAQLAERMQQPLPIAEKFSLRDIMEQARAFQSQSELFQSTGGVHACALFEGQEELFFREDIGRHNAFDKVIGAALLQNVALPGKWLLTSGRVPSDMIIKAVYAALPLIVSRSAPTLEAIEMAQAQQITLCGFTRGDRTNIYSVPERFEERM